MQAFCVDDLRAGGNFDCGADGGDFSVFNYQCAVFDRKADECDDFGVGDGVDARGLLRAQTDARREKSAEEVKEVKEVQ